LFDFRNFSDRFYDCVAEALGDVEVVEIELSTTEVTDEDKTW